MKKTAWTAAFFSLAAGAPATAQPLKLEPTVLPAPAEPGPNVKCLDALNGEGVQ